MESRQCGRRSRLVEETKQVPAGKRTEKYNKVTSCYLWDDTVPHRDIYAHMMAKRDLWMTNLVRSRFGARVDPRCGRCNTEKVENMAHIIVRCQGRKI